MQLLCRAPCAHATRVGGFGALAICLAPCLLLAWPRAAGRRSRIRLTDERQEAHTNVKILTPAGGGPPLPPRVDYTLYLNDSSSKRDVKRKVKIGNIKRAHMKKALERAALTLPPGAPPDYRGWAQAAIEALVGRVGPTGTRAVTRSPSIGYCPPDVARSLVTRSSLGVSFAGRMRWRCRVQDTAALATWQHHDRQRR